MAVSADSVEAELRVGMLDMALAKLLSKQHHTIEFPTLLLPENVEPGSIVRLTCTRAAEAELEDAEQFEKVQSRILESFAKNLPKQPVLRARNVTQTSVVLEWDPIDIASADLRYLALYKGAQRLGLIPNALKRTSMKVSNLEIDMPYTFRLVLSSSAGDFESDVLEVQTHKMSDLSGVVVCIGSLNHSSISVEDIEDTLQRLGCKPAQSDIKLDTTHFLCTTEGGSQYERAVELSIPIVRPEWLKACEAERKLVSVRGYYLSADPREVPPTRERTLASPQAPAPEQQQPPATDSAAAQPNNTRHASSEEEEVSATQSKSQRVRFDVPADGNASVNGDAQIAESEANNSVASEASDAVATSPAQGSVPDRESSTDIVSDEVPSDLYSGENSHEPVTEHSAEPTAESVSQPPSVEAEHTAVKSVAEDTESTSDPYTSSEPAIESANAPLKDDLPADEGRNESPEPIQTVPDVADFPETVVQPSGSVVEAVEPTDPASESTESAGKSSVPASEPNESAVSTVPTSDPAEPSKSVSEVAESADPGPEDIESVSPAAEESAEPSPETDKSAEPKSEFGVSDPTEPVSEASESAEPNDSTVGSTPESGPDGEGNPEASVEPAAAEAAVDNLGQKEDSHSAEHSPEPTTSEPASESSAAQTGGTSNKSKKNKKKKSKK